MPLIGRFFNKRVQLPFTYSVDEAYNVTASLEVNPSEENDTKTIIAKAFPNLSIFTQRSKGRISIHVPRINYPESSKY